jgi:predicted ATPase/DNA-binding winged helix-turn-helix (wHTH) protein
MCSFAEQERDMASPNILQFEPFRLDVSDERLWRDEDALKLTRKAFVVLRYLAEHSGHLVTREELFNAAWSTTYASDDALSACIREIRRVLEDHAQSPQFIETVRGRGYRFVAPVATTESTEVQPGSMSIAATSVQLQPEHISFVSSGPVVSRETELQQLHNHLAQAQKGRRQVVFITGEPGIGKTTLVDIFSTQVQALDAILVAHGQCIEQYGSGEAYLPLLEALSRLARDVPGESLLRVLRQQAPSWLLQMPAFTSAADQEALRRAGGGATQTRMLRELAEALEAFTATHPLVLILEDLHWSDVSTLDWLSYIARRGDPACLLLVGTFRPQEVQAQTRPLHAVAHDLLRHDKAVDRALTNLTEADVAAYLTQRFGQHLQVVALARHLHQRTAGNPMFVVTMVEEMLRQKVLRRSGDGWELSGGGSAISVAVPESLRQLMEQQLSQLKPEAQTILEAASAAGTEFSAAAVAAATEQATEVVENLCASMARQGLLIRFRGTVSWPDATIATQFGFSHALYQELLYKRVPAARRVRWHRQIGTRLATAYGPQADEIAAELAMHFVQGETPDQAIQYLGIAGDNALRRSANKEAITHLTDALALLSTLPPSEQRDRRELELQNRLGVALLATKGFGAPEVQQSYSRARELSQAVGETTEPAAVLWGLWWFHEVRVELETARELAQQLLAIAQQSKDSGALMQAHRAMAQTCYWLGELDQAQAHLEQGLALYVPEQHGASAFLYGQDPGVGLRNFSALVLWHQGYPDSALERINESVALARDVAHPFSTAFALSFLTWVHHYRRSSELTQEHAEVAMDLCRKHGFVFFLAQQSVLRGWALVQKGQTTEGIEQMREGLAAYRATGAVGEGAYLGALLAEAYGIAGQVQKGLRLIEEELALAKKHQLILYEAEVLRIKGELILLQANQRSLAAKSVACFTRALEIARRHGANSLELRAAMSICQLGEQYENQDPATTLLAPIFNRFREGLDTADLEDAKAILRM